MVSRAQQCCCHLLTSCFVYMQISHLGNNINSSSSDHSLWHQIDYQNSGRGRWRNTDSEDDERQNMNQRGGEGAADISIGAIRKACDEEDKTCTLCTQAYCTPIQTNNSTSLGCTLEINTHLFSLWANQTSVHPFGKQGAWLHRGPMRKPPWWNPGLQQYKCDL